eukprot:augustus_masked-scaffold_3-processed-gene-3.61-mRNA-1 protein AED:0.42 eAED:0.42 QI:0/-1/0/1/-1/1/1/0/166
MLSSLLRRSTVTAKSFKYAASLSSAEISLVSRTFSTFKYLKSHEYLLPTGKEGEFLVGISENAVNQLGEIVYVELPEEGETFEKGEVFGTVESVKAASDVYLPVTGEVTAINNDIVDQPELVNGLSQEEAWFVKIQADSSAFEEDSADLLGEEEYKEFVASEEQEG